MTKISISRFVFHSSRPIQLRFAMRTRGRDQIEKKEFASFSLCPSLAPCLSMAHERVHACNGSSEMKTEIEGNTRHHRTLTKSPIRQRNRKRRSLNYGNCTIDVVVGSCRHSSRVIELGDQTAEMYLCG